MAPWYSGFDIANHGAAFVTLTTSGASRSTLYIVSGLPANAQFTSLDQVRAVLRGIAVAP